MRTAVLIAFGALLLASAAPSLAGSPYTRDDTPYAAPRVPNPAASGVPNVPDLQGCVKWCQRDMNPCDPPLFKRTDGRCNYFD